MGKKKNIPDYLKKSLKGTTVGGSLGVDDNEYVTVPKGTLNISKGKTTIEGGIAKPISKFDKENINSEISLGISREFDDESGGVSLTGSKSQLVFKPLPSDDPKQRQPDISLAKASLQGWEPKIDLKEGLQKTIEYFKNIT